MKNIFAICLLCLCSCLWALRPGASLAAGQGNYEPPPGQQGGAQVWGTRDLEAEGLERRGQSHTWRDSNGDIVTSVTPPPPPQQPQQWTGPIYVTPWVSPDGSYGTGGQWGGVTPGIPAPGGPYPGFPGPGNPRPGPHYGPNQGPSPGPNAGPHYGNQRPQHRPGPGGGRPAYPPQSPGYQTGGPGYNWQQDPYFNSNPHPGGPTWPDGAPRPGDGYGSQGYGQGYNQGFGQGYDQGYNQGYDRGYRQGNDGLPPQNAPQEYAPPTLNQRADQQADILAQEQAWRQQGAPQVQPDMPQSFGPPTGTPPHNSQPAPGQNGAARSVPFSSIHPAGSGTEGR